MEAKATSRPAPTCRRTASRSLAPASLSASTPSTLRSPTGLWHARLRRVPPNDAVRDAGHDCRGLGEGAPGAYRGGQEEVAGPREESLAHSNVARTRPRNGDTRGRQAKRDIVQFVAFRDFVNKSTHAFSSELLAEIPAQLVGFMKSRGLQPRSQAPPLARVEPAGVDVAAPGSVFVQDKLAPQAMLAPQAKYAAATKL